MEVVRGSIPRSARCFYFCGSQSVSSCTTPGGTPWLFSVLYDTVVVFSTVRHRGCFQHCTTPWLFSVLYTTRAKAWAFGSKLHRGCTVAAAAGVAAVAKVYVSCIIHTGARGRGRASKRTPGLAERLSTSLQFSWKNSQQNLLTCGKSFASGCDAR